MNEHIENLSKMIVKIQENNFDDVSINVDNKIYNVALIDLEDFFLICNEEIEDFIRRTKPKDDIELSKLISLYIYNKLQK